MSTNERAIGALLLQREIEAFYTHEAELLDDRRFDDWLELLAEDITYFMPLRRNVKFGSHDTDENSREGQDAAWFDEGKHTLSQRVAQLNTGIHWAEEPLSRVRHLVTNVRIADLESAATARELDARSNFLVYRNRVDDETDLFVGERRDRLRRVTGGWQVAARVILLDQSTLLAKNLTLFF